MNKYSFTEEEKQFLEVGEQNKDKVEKESKKVHFDGKQYSVKLPRKFMEAIEFKKGDKIIFELTKPFDINKNPTLELKYKKKDGT